MIVRIHKLIIMLLICLFPVAMAFTADIQYKDYQKKSRYRDYFEINIEKNTITITVFEDTRSLSLSFPVTTVQKTEKRISLSDDVYFDTKGLHFRGNMYPYSSIYDTRVFGEDNIITIDFRTRSGSSGRVSRMHRGNRISFNRNLVVEEDEFVRGIVFSVGGNIEVYGEVNKDVISLFGDIYVGPGAVARGDIVTGTGKLTLAKDASIYGESYNGSGKHVKRYHRYYRKQKTVSLSGMLLYNRIDGLAPYAKITFSDNDSLLPTVWLQAGYGFASQRGRFELGLEQTLWRKRPLSFGAVFYRNLSSDDDWLLTNHENTAFALLATEDFKDYYEAEGGLLYLKFIPYQTVKMNTAYRYEETNWLDAHRHLWSMFGGDKLFRDNFSTVDSPYREHGMGEIDTTTNAFLSTTIDWKTLDKDDLFSRSGWFITQKFEWSHPNLKSDFDYRRYTTILRRYQKVNQYSMVLLRAMFSGSDGYLPMNKRFYLGGLGTLRGYKHKEYMGNRFWMTNIEYRFTYPRSNFAASVFWDAGQIANSKLTSDIDIKQSIGVALFIGTDIRINLSKRLDRSYDNTPKIYVRLDHVF